MRKSDSFLFLFEMIMAMLIFFIASSICVSVFAKAHRMNRESQELNAAVSAEKNLAELLSTADSPDSAQALILEAYPQAEITSVSDIGASGFQVSIGFDSDFQEAASEEASCLMTADVSAEDMLMSADIHFYPVSDSSNSADSVYDLHVENAITR